MYKQMYLLNLEVNGDIENLKTEAKKTQNPSTEEGGLGIGSLGIWGERDEACPSTHQETHALTKLAAGSFP